MASRTAPGAKKPNRTPRQPKRKGGITKPARRHDPMQFLPPNVSDQLPHPAGEVQIILTKLAIALILLIAMA